MTIDESADEAMTATTYVRNTSLLAGLLGPRDENLRAIERSYPTSKIAIHGNEITVAGRDAAKILRLFDELVLVLESGQSLDAAKIARTEVVVNHVDRARDLDRVEGLATLEDQDQLIEESQDLRGVGADHCDLVAVDGDRGRRVRPFDHA